MKAAVIDRLGAAPRPAELPDPVAARDGQVVIKVEAAALNPVDLIIAGGLHPAGQPKLPYVPAIEAVGTIVAGPERGLRVRVTVSAGLVAGLDGGAAELLLADRAGCLPVPDGLDNVAAAAVGVVGASADLALREARLTAGEDVLVLGATGAFGLAFVRLARLAGARRVVAAGRNPERLATVPADATVLLGAEPLAQQLSGPVDLVIDPLTGPYITESLSCLKPGGRYLNVGGAAGEGATVSVDWLRASRLTFIGFSASGVDRSELLAAYERIMDLAAGGSFTLPVETYPLDDAARAWEAQAGSPGTKIVIVP